MSVGTYAAAVQTQKRLNLLEFDSSEDERKKYSNDVLITHPDLNIGSEDAVEKVKRFFRTKLKMENRVMDANLLAKKATRANTVRVTLSNRRYKSFLFQTRKKLREETPIECENLYINDHLTPYNHKILIGLKNKRRTFTRENDPFKSI